MGYILILASLPVMLWYTIFKRPWFGVMMYYLFSILQPKFIWFWIFPPDLAITKFFVLAIIAGVFFKIINGQYKLSLFSDRQNIALFIFFVVVHLSNLFTDYPPNIFSRLMLSTLNTIIAVYFLGQMCKPSLNEIKQLIYICAGIVMYYSYWANMQYITGEMYLYSLNGRLSGPVNSTYADENGFAIVFVIFLPSIAFLFFELKKIWQKAFIVVAVLAALHSLVLVGSRGGLLAFCFMGLYALLFQVKTKKGKTPYAFIILMIVFFLFFYSTQGGALKDRTSETIASSKVEDDKPLDPRILAWKVGRDMIFDHPLLGVGFERFLQAAHTEYPGRTVNVAHNTFIQITAGSGILAGGAWLFLVFNGIKRGRQIKKRYPTPGTIENYLNNSLTAGLVGYFVVSIFLDLLVAEQFYCLLLMQLLLRKLVLSNKSNNNHRVNISTLENKPN